MEGHTEGRRVDKVVKIKMATMCLLTPVGMSPSYYGWYFHITFLLVCLCYIIVGMYRLTFLLVCLPYTVVGISIHY